MVKTAQDQQGTDRFRVARIDVVAAILGRDELQWVDVTKITPAAIANVEGAARFGGFAALPGRDRKYGIRNEIGPDTVNPINFELGGRPGPQTISVLQGLTAKLAEGGELNSVLRRLRLTSERTLIRAEADALNATSANEEQAAGEPERGDECDGGW